MSMTLLIVFMLGQHLGPAHGAPTLTSVFPAHALQGSSSPVVITVTGSNFVSGRSTVDWNGVALVTTFVSSTQMTASIPSADFVSAGTDQITVATSGKGGGISSAHNFIVVSPVVFNSVTLPQAMVGTAYSFTLRATGGTIPYAWSITSGTLPAGLTLNSSTGVISGTPTTAVTNTFTVTVADSTNLLA